MFRKLVLGAGRSVVGYFDCGGPIGRVPTAQLAVPSSAIAARPQRAQLLRQDPVPAQPNAHILPPYQDQGIV
jgi:hypothetical protein